MALKASITEADHAALPEAVREHYTKQSDGAFTLALADAGSLPEINKLTRALEKERGEHGATKSKLHAYDGRDAAAAREAVEKVAQMANWSPEDKVRAQVESVKAQMLAAHTAELGKTKSEAESYYKELDRVVRENALRQALIEAGAEETGIDLLLPAVLKTTKMDRLDDGRFVVRALNDDGYERFDDKGAPISLKAHAEGFRAKYALAFKGSGASGGGAGGGSSGSGGRGGSGSVMVLDPSDHASIRKNAELIASGKARVAVKE